MKKSSVNMLYNLFIKSKKYFARVLAEGCKGARVFGVPDNAKSPKAIFASPNLEVICREGWNKNTALSLDTSCFMWVAKDMEVVKVNFRKSPLLF